MWFSSALAIYKAEVLSTLILRSKAFSSVSLKVKAPGRCTAIEGLKKGRADEQTRHGKKSIRKKSLDKRVFIEVSSSGPL